MAKAKATKLKLVKTDHPVIEKGIEVPASRKRSSWEWASALNPGDSFFLSFKQYSKYAATSVRTWAAREFPKWEIVSRMQDDGVRIWRLK